MTNDIYNERNLFTTREVPWMKLGKIIEQPLNAKEAARLAGLDFDVLKLPAGYQDEDGNWVPVPGQFQNVRATDHKPLGWVGKEYVVLQNSEAFDFMDFAGGKYVAGGELKGGTQAFLVVQPDITMDIDGDLLELFVTLRTSHDRSRAVEVQLTPLRGMCMNQLNLRSFTKQAVHRWSISHNRSMEAKMHNAHQVLSRLDDYKTATEQTIRDLMAKEITTDQARRIADKVIIHGGNNRQANIDRVLENFLNNTTTVGWNRTGWGLVNAVSENMEWQRRGGTSESRFRGALTGQTFKAVNLAAELALAA